MTEEEAIQAPLLHLKSTLGAGRGQVGATQVGLEGGSMHSKAGGAMGGTNGGETAGSPKEGEQTAEVHQL